MQYMKLLQERLSKYYKLDKSAMGNLAKSINSAYTETGKADIDDVSVEVSGGFNTAQANWNALFGMSRLMRQIQKDMADGTGAFAVNSDDKNTESHGNETAEPSTTVHVKNPKGMWQRAAFTSLSTQNSAQNTQL